MSISREDIKEAKLKAELDYKQKLLTIENVEISNYMIKAVEYYTDTFSKEGESYQDRQQFFDYAMFLKKHIDDSRAIMEEMHELRKELGIEPEEW